MTDLSSGMSDEPSACRFFIAIFPPILYNYVIKCDNLKSGAFMFPWKNPILPSGADPWLVSDEKGGYYFICTTKENLILRHTHDLSDFENAESKIVWLPPESGAGSCQLWAPELHHINGQWLIYYAASDGTGDAGRRMHVVACSSNDPMTGTWSHLAMINTARTGLDGTVLRRGDEMYFCYAGYGNYPEHGSALYIAKMKDFCTLEGDEICLTVPEYWWERQGGMPINEGPAVLYRNGRIFLVYSASTTWAPDYCLGMLTAQEDADLLNPASWKKESEPVFKKCPERRVLAPGHNGFSVLPDGTDVIVYHAIEHDDTSENLDPRKRSPRIQPFTWREDGTPDFGTPVACDR